MEEFLDSIPKKWMLNFNKFESEKFTRNDWKCYLESMIRMDPVELQVIMSPPPSFIKGKNFAVNSDVKVSYMQKIEPRKIGNIDFLKTI